MEGDKLCKKWCVEGKSFCWAINNVPSPSEMMLVPPVPNIAKYLIINA